MMIPRKKYWWFLMSLMSISYLNAQSSLQFSKEAYLIADQQLYHLTNAEFVGSEGPDQLWDFSELENLELISSYLHPLNQREWALIFPEANMIIEENDLLIFIKADRSTLAEYGYISGERMVIYDQAVVRFPFPFEFGSSIEGNYSGIRHSKREQRLSGKYTTVADAYGTLILPENRIYKDVIRVRFSKRLDNNLSEDIIYRWYSTKNDPVSRSPLMTIFTRKEGGQTQITGSAFLSDQSAITFDAGSEKDFSEILENVSENAQNYEYNIRPNPFNDFAVIEFSLPIAGNVIIQSFDNSGKLIQTILNEYRAAGNHQLRLTPHGHFVQHIRIQVDDLFIASKKVFELEVR